MNKETKIIDENIKKWTKLEDKVEIYMENIYCANQILMIMMMMKMVKMMIISGVIYKGNSI